MFWNLSWLWVFLVVRTQKFLRSKFGDPEDEMLDGSDEEEQAVWAGRFRHGADVGNEVCFPNNAST